VLLYVAAAFDNMTRALQALPLAASAGDSARGVVFTTRRNMALRCDTQTARVRNAPVTVLLAPHYRLLAPLCTLAAVCLANNDARKASGAAATAGGRNGVMAAQDGSTARGMESVTMWQALAVRPRRIIVAGLYVVHINGGTADMEANRRWQHQRRRW